MRIANYGPELISQLEQINRFEYFPDIFLSNYWIFSNVRRKCCNDCMLWNDLACTLNITLWLNTNKRMRWTLSTHLTLCILHKLWSLNSSFYRIFATQMSICLIMKLNWWIELHSHPRIHFNFHGNSWNIEISMLQRLTALKLAAFNHRMAVLNWTHYYIHSQKFVCKLRSFVCCLNTKFISQTAFQNTLFWWWWIC